MTTYDRVIQDFLPNRTYEIIEREHDDLVEIRSVYNNEYRICVCVSKDDILSGINKFWDEFKNIKINKSKSK